MFLLDERLGTESLVVRKVSCWDPYHGSWEVANAAVDKALAYWNDHLARLPNNQGPAAPPMRVDLTIHEARRRVGRYQALATQHNIVQYCPPSSTPSVAFTAARVTPCQLSPHVSTGEMATVVGLMRVAAHGDTLIMDTEGQVVYAGEKHQLVEHRQQSLLFCTLETVLDQLAASGMTVSRVAVLFSAGRVLFCTVNICEESFVAVLRQSIWGATRSSLATVVVGLCWLCSSLIPCPVPELSLWNFRLFDEASVVRLRVRCVAELIIAIRVKLVMCVQQLRQSAARYPRGLDTVFGHWAHPGESWSLSGMVDHRERISSALLKTLNEFIRRAHHTRGASCCDEARFQRIVASCNDGLILSQAQLA